MDRLEIEGGVALNGTVKISGAKNSALPILISSLLSPETSTYERVPDLHDVASIRKILEHLGAKTTMRGSSVRVEATQELTPEAPYDLVRKMRASFLVLGPLLGRLGKARVSMPGGCAIGARPVGFHLEGLRLMGAEIELDGGDVVARAPTGLRGAEIAFPFPSVGATEHLMMAAALGRGQTTLNNCACEPEIVDLAVALSSMGARVVGAGTPTIVIEGQTVLKGASAHPIIGDRIEAATFLFAAIATQGTVRTEGVDPEHLTAVLEAMRAIGARVEIGADWIEVKGVRPLRPVSLETAPFPGYPTDCQAQLMAVLALTPGISTISENVFENRFMHVQELARMGASIEIDGRAAKMTGVSTLKGAPVMATDLRASASLVVAALAATGKTVVSRIYHLDRGYERMEDKLSGLGAKIRRLK